MNDKTTLKRELDKRLRQLPEGQLRDVLNYVESLRDDVSSSASSIEGKIKERLNEVPDEALDDLPTDASKNLDHYLYGSQKMKTLFADALYWVALLNPQDQWHQTAREAADEYASARLVTTEAVLVEVLNFFAAFRTEMRQAAAGTVEDILDDNRIAVVASSHRTFIDGLELLRLALTKTTPWSTACPSR